MFHVKTQIEFKLNQRTNWFQTKSGQNKVHFGNSKQREKIIGQISRVLLYIFEALKKGFKNSMRF